PKGYIYSAMAFSVLVEAINIIMRQRRLAAEAAHPKSPTVAAAAVQPMATTSKAKPRSTPAARAHARPKSAPRPKTKS
ncbi:MAG TPA: hypothetical protein VGO70_05150, partial [Arsenicitalea sp.]|nr:hypothetical protein [Arsenicitalea sp.]